MGQIQIGQFESKDYNRKRQIGTYKSTNINLEVQVDKIQIGIFKATKYKS